MRYSRRFALLLLPAIVLTVLFLDFEADKSTVSRPSLPIGQSQISELARQEVRLPVGFLGFHRFGGNSEVIASKIVMEELVTAQLKLIPRIQLRSVERIQSALGQAGVTDIRAITASQIRHLGECIGADWIIWCTYEPKGNDLLITVHVTNGGVLAMKGTTDGLTITATDCYDIRDRVTTLVLRELGVVPTLVERAKMKRLWTPSADALEWYGHARVLAMQGKAIAEIEPVLRKAIVADPRFAEAYAFLAEALSYDRRLEEAKMNAIVALDLNPDNALGHKILAACLEAAGKSVEAGREYHIASRLDPDDVDTLLRLGFHHYVGGRHSPAIEAYSRVLQLNPYPPFAASLHAQLASCYVHQGFRGKADAELREVATMGVTNDIVCEQALVDAYSMLNDLPLAIEHCRRVISLALAAQSDARHIAAYEGRLKQMTTKLSPVYLAHAPATKHTASTLSAELQHRLTATELKMAINPLRSNSEMARWAQDLTADGANSVQKAKMLFDALVKNNTDLSIRSRTAQEAFLAWNDPKAFFHCLDLAFLYVALAREVGIESYFVDVLETYDEVKALHACASVRVGDKMLLVDPALCFFGAPHRKFMLLDDLQAMGVYQASLHNVDRDRIAFKLAPEVLGVQLGWFAALIAGDRWQEAGKILQLIKQNRMDDWASEWCQAQIELHDGDSEKALSRLEKAVRANAFSGPLQLALGDAYLRRGDISQARDAYQNALGCLLSSEDAEEARRFIVKCDGQLIGKNQRKP